MRRWGTVGILSILQLVENSESGLINTVFPIIAQGLHLTLGDLGVLTSLGKFIRMIFGPVWAAAGDRFGRKLVLVITALWGAWLIVAGLANNFPQLLIFYGLGTLGTVAGEPISNGLVPDIFKAEERGKVYGTMRSVTSLGSVIVTPLLGQLAAIPNNQGWRYGMFIMGGVGVVGGILTWLFITDPKHEVTDAQFRAASAGAAKQPERPSTSFKLADVPHLIAIPTIALMAVQLLFITSLVLFAFQVVFLVDVRKYSMQQATGIVGLFYLGFMASSFLGGFLGDVFTRWRPTGRITLMQLYCAAFAIMSFITMQVDLPKGLVDTGAWVLFGLVASIGFSGCVLPMVSQVVLPQYRATSFALLFSLIQGLISALLSLGLGAWAQQYGLRPVMLALITVPYAINAFVWFGFYRLYPRDVRRMQEQRAAQS